MDGFAAANEAGHADRCGFEGCSFSCLSSIATNFSMRATRVSGFLAVWTRNRMA
jgi:hypothetical protein